MRFSCSLEETVPKQAGSSSPTLPFEGYPHNVVLALPSVVEVQVLHYGLVGVPDVVAVAPSEFQKVRKFLIWPPYDVNLDARVISR